MTITTINKIIKTVINNCPDLDNINAHEFEKISVDNAVSTFDKSVSGGYYVPYKRIENKAVIFRPTNGDIAIYKPVHFKGICIGYRFVAYIETALKTQLDVTAELMYNVNCIISADVIAHITTNAAAN